MPRRRKPIRNTLPGEAHGGSLLSSSAVCCGPLFSCIYGFSGETMRALPFPTCLLHTDDTEPPPPSPLPVRRLRLGRRPHGAGGGCSGRAGARGAGGADPAPSACTSHCTIPSYFDQELDAPVDVLVDQVEQPSLPVPTPLVEEGVLVEPALVEQGEQTPPPLLAPLMEDVLVDQVEQPSLPIPASLVQHSPPPARRSAALTSARSSTTHCCITKRAIHNWEPYA
ncbi:hypothetical protein SETIT_1G225600v2 [Setaria italica]|uniref:Uncharacterized protein n=1 Tax=Setaria italica TaxID=4555 RepID=A0A368PNH1_SETIT|nr:hypothetical protein SETIT_1G225600v2 [Setaria italica]